MSKKKLKLLIVINLLWAVLGFYADFAWLSRVPLPLVPLTAICSLYPPLLTAWYLLKYFDRKIPQWFTYWLILGTASYWLMAQFYFPLLMSWTGVNFHDLGSMFWVSVYGCQSLLLIRHLDPPDWRTVLPGTIYILTADLFHYFYPTFVDFTISGYPLWMKILTGLVALFLQLGTTVWIFYRTRPATRTFATATIG
jgi:hypothetical protein